MIDAGNYVWNAGIFLFQASVMLANAKKFEPKMLAGVQAAVDDAREDKIFGISMTRTGCKSRGSHSITQF